MVLKALNKSRRENGQRLINGDGVAVKEISLTVPLQSRVTTDKNNILYIQLRYKKRCHYHKKVTSEEEQAKLILTKHCLLVP